MEVDGIPSEIWKYSGEKMKEWVWRFYNRIWRGEGWIEKWKKGVIVPMIKKGEGRKVEEYSGVTLTPLLYKVYATVLAERLREEVRKKKVVPENQIDFRKEMGTMDNIYALNYLVNRNLSREKGKLVAFF